MVRGKKKNLFCRPRVIYCPNEKEVVPKWSEKKSQERIERKLERLGRVLKRVASNRLGRRRSVHSYIDIGWRCAAVSCC